MNKYYFTFGSGHVNGDGTPLGNRYCEIEDVDEGKARARMAEKRGLRWSMTYLEHQKAKSIDRFNLTPIALDELSKQQEEA